MDKYLKDHIAYLLCVRILKVIPVSGGDISQAYLLETETERFFCKLNFGESAHAMFLAEKTGLEAIAQTKAIAAPKVLLCEALERGGLLLMEYIEPKSPSRHEMEVLGHQLAALHRASNSESFGWETDNFIGSLPQSNKENKAWPEFYVQERLLPQLKLAKDNRTLDMGEIPSQEALLKICQNLFPVAQPSLLHGDLWSGNYLISQSGTPYLIDPATYFGHHEVDIAMTRLFGGFDAAFYTAYTQNFPDTKGKKERTDIYQLYFLLVHLNLFGKSYYGSVISILNRYFK